MTGKEVAIYDIAFALNISIATASRALKGDRAINIKTGFAEEMGYRINHLKNRINS